jgi:hypothetical protein
MRAVSAFAFVGVAPWPVAAAGAASSSAPAAALMRHRPFDTAVAERRGRRIIQTTRAAVLVGAPALSMPKAGRVGLGAPPRTRFAALTARLPKSCDSSYCD